MTDFDDRFADRVREVFDAYDEPVDPQAWARMRAALGPGVAPDHPPLAGPTTRRRRGIGAAVLAVLAVASALWLRTDLTDAPAPPTVAEAWPPALDVPPPQETTEAATSRPDLSAPPTGGRASAPRSRIPALAGSPGPDRSISTGPPDEEAPGPAAAPGEAHTTSPSGAIAQIPPLVSDSSRAPSGPAGPSVFASPARLADVPLTPALASSATPSARRLGLSVIAGVASTFSSGRFADGGGVSAGVAGAVPLGRRLSISGGAQLAYARFETESEATAFALSNLDDDPTRSLDVPLFVGGTTLAIEIPLDLAVGVVRSRRARVAVAVGLTSAVYLAQSFREEGTSYSSRSVADPTSAGGTLSVVDAMSYETENTVGAGGRVDLARQLALAVRLTPGSSPSAPTVEVYGRLPLGGLTSRDLPLTSLGARVRVPIR